MICTFFLAGRCSNDKTATLGYEQEFRNTTCSSNFRSKSDEWLWIWFKSISIPRAGNITVALKSDTGLSRTTLISNDSRDFDVQKTSDWYQIEQTAGVSFVLSYMSYTAQVSIWQQQFLSSHLKETPKPYKVYYTIFTYALFREVFRFKISSCPPSWIFVGMHDTSQLGSRKT